jgi:hypothetical protein
MITHLAHRVLLACFSLILCLFLITAPSGGIAAAG